MEIKTTKIDISDARYESVEYVDFYLTNDDNIEDVLRKISYDYPGCEREFHIGFIRIKKYKDRTNEKPETSTKTRR